MSPHTKKRFIVASLIFFVTLAMSGAMLYQVHQKDTLLQQQTIALAKERSQENYYYGLRKTAETSASDRQELAQYFLSQESESIDVLTWLETNAAKSAVTYETKSLQKITDKDTKTDWVEVAMSFTGSRAQVEQFISTIENMPYLSHITTLNTTARSSTIWEANLTLRVMIYNYAQ